MHRQISEVALFGLYLHPLLNEYASKLQDYEQEILMSIESQRHFKRDGYFEFTKNEFSLSPSTQLSLKYALTTPTLIGKVSQDKKLLDDVAFYLTDDADKLDHFVLVANFSQQNSINTTSGLDVVVNTTPLLLQTDKQKLFDPAYQTIARSLELIHASQRSHNTLSKGLLRYLRTPIF